MINTCPSALRWAENVSPPVTANILDNGGVLTATLKPSLNPMPLEYTWPGVLPSRGGSFNPHANVLPDCSAITCRRPPFISSIPVNGRVATPSGVVTVIRPVLAPVGTEVEIEFDDAVNDALTFPNLTDVVVPRCVPDIRT